MSINAAPKNDNIARICRELDDLQSQPIPLQPFGRALLDMKTGLRFGLLGLLTEASAPDATTAAKDAALREMLADVDAVRAQLVNA